MSNGFHLRTSHSTHRSTWTQYVTGLEPIRHGTREFRKTTNATAQKCQRQSKKSIYQRYGVNFYERSQSHEQNYFDKLQSAKSLQSCVSAPLLKKLIERYETKYPLWF